MSNISSVTVTVHGRVQGVSYRAFAESWAQQFGLAGYVFNMPDGVSVRLHAEGERSRLEQLIVKLKHGPPAARVESVDVDWSATPEHLDGFDIRRG